jgi:hypothetical protein
MLSDRSIMIHTSCGDQWQREESVAKRPGGKSVYFNVRLEPAMHRRLVKLARDNERTLASELRLALRRHLEAQKNPVA